MLYIGNVLLNDQYCKYGIADNVFSPSSAQKSCQRGRWSAESPDEKECLPTFVLFPFSGIGTKSV